MFLPLPVFGDTTYSVTCWVSADTFVSEFLPGSNYNDNPIMTAELWTSLTPKNYTVGVNPSFHFTDVYKTDAVYNTAWSATTGSVYSGSGYFFLGQKLDENYTIYRAGAAFKTTDLPGDWYSQYRIILSAKLSFYLKDDYSDDNFNIVIRNCTRYVEGSGWVYWAPHDTMAAGDYNKANHYDDLGSISTVGLSTGWFNITFNAAGLA